MCRNRRFIDLAKQVALSSPNSKHRHASLLTKGGRVLAVGQNTELAVYPNHHRTRHAEEDVLRSGTLRKTVCNLYVVRVTWGEGQLSDSLPCSTCMSFLLFTRVRQVFYTDKNGEMHSINLNTLRTRLAKQGTGAPYYRTLRHLASSEDQ